MKIVFTTDQIYLHGGIEKVMAIKANYWASQIDTEVIIMTTEQRGHQPCYTLDRKVQLIDLGVNYDRSKSYFSGGNLIKAWKHFFLQKKMSDKLNPDVIISPNFNFDHYWWPWFKKNALLIKERHGSRYFEQEQRAYASLLSKIKFRVSDWLEKKYDYIVVLNEDEKKYVKTGNAFVIPNPVEHRHDLKADLTEKIVVAAGRISPVKAFDQLIKVWPKIKNQFPDWQLHIYGEDYLNTKLQLQELVEKLQLEDQVIFKGSVDDMPRIMASASVYAMSSQTECFPMVLLEALSVGLPIVSYDCPNGPRHIVTNGKDGILVEDKNTIALEEALSKMLRDVNLRKEYGETAKVNIKRFYTVEVMKLWETLFNLKNV